MKNYPKTLALAALLCTGAAMAQSPPAPVKIHTPNGDSSVALQWQPDEVVLKPIPKPGIYSRVLVGFPADAGMYLVRVRMDPDTKNGAHTHPDGRITTVLSGSVYYGIGSQADVSKAKRFAAGSVYYTPPNTPHFLITTNESVVYEEAGVGPSKSVPLGDEKP